MTSHSQLDDRKGRSPIPRPELQRSQSDLPIAGPKSSPKPAITPCITAMDLTSEQIKRNYSHDDLQKWDRARSPLPPLCPMKGIGRYRTAVAADPRWRTEHFRKQISGLDGLENMVSELDMTDVNGLSCEEWQALAGAGPRRDSGISSNSTCTTSSVGVQDPVIDPHSGARVSRGFSPSASSSNRSSFNAHSRKGSTLSMANGQKTVEAQLIPKSPPRQKFALAAERRISGPLSTINELQSNISSINDVPKKMEKPCDFSDRGDPDSAVASDIDEEEWTDENEPSRVSAITQMLKEGRKLETQPGLTRTRTTSSDKKRGRGSTTSIDRSRTIRANTTNPRRKKSRGQQVSHQRMKSDEKKLDNTVASPPSTESALNGTELFLHIRTSARQVDNNGHQDYGSANEHTLVADEHDFWPHVQRSQEATTLRS